MRFSHGFAIALISMGAAIVGCAADGSDDDDSATTTQTGTTPTGTGGSGGTGATGGTGGTGATGGTGGTGATGGTGGSGGDPCAQLGAEHLLVSEVASHGPQAANGNQEFIEIWNPTGQSVDLSSYYLSDNNVYYRIAYGEAFNPTESSPDTDFLVKFPDGAQIGAGEVIVIQAGPDFYAAWSSCPDFAIGTSTAPDCNGNAVPLMAEPTNGDLGGDPGAMLSNSREMVMLFCWNGSTDTITDVDYLAWGDSVEVPSRVDKTGQAGYADDTAIGSQSFAPRYFAEAGNDPQGESIGRCDDTETDETTSGGNGPAGHDETSEDMSQTFTVFTTASPGAVNTCP